ncbi:MAG: hypothetical protein ACLSA0_06575 [Eisenbergiella massiliensis]
MELFHEIYSCYFDVVRRILAEAQDTPVSVKRMEEIALSHGFQETALAILPKLTSGAWPLLEEAGEKEYRSRLSQAPPDAVKQPAEVVAEGASPGSANPAVSYG